VVRRIVGAAVLGTALAGGFGSHPATPAGPVVGLTAGGGSSRVGASASPGPGIEQIVVRAGDTLTGIAVELHRPERGLIALNPALAVNPNLIRPGQLITVGRAAPGIDRGGRRVRVRRGDTLSGIAAALGRSVPELIALNPTLAAHPNLIHPGRTVTASPGTPAPTPAPAPERPGPARAAAPVRPNHHPTTPVTPGWLEPVLVTLAGVLAGAGNPDAVAFPLVWWSVVARPLLRRMRDRVRTARSWLGRVVLRGWAVSAQWEHRLYPNISQQLVALVPVLGPWLAHSPHGARFTQLLHLKLKVFTRTPRVWRREPGPRGVRARMRAARGWFGRARAYAAKLRYNRAFTGLLPWMTPPTGPEVHGTWFGLGLKISAGNLGTFTVLDLAGLGGTTNNRNRVVGLFPIVRVSVQVYLGPARLGFDLVHFDLPGKKLEQKLATPRLAGWQRLNLARRAWQWVRVHDLKLWSWRPWAFISQTQFLVGVGPRESLLPNFVEYRLSAQTFTVTRHGRPVGKIHMVSGVGPMLGRALGRSARAVGGRLSRTVPRRWRTGARRWAGRWRLDRAGRQAGYERTLRTRGLRQLDRTIGAQLDRLTWLDGRIRTLERRVSPHTRADPVAERALAILSARLARAHRLRARLVAALNTNHAARAAVEEGPGSTRTPVPAAHPAPLTLTTGHITTAGVVGSGVLPDAHRAAPGAGRVGFDLPALSGRSDPGHPDNTNRDAMAGAVRTADGRIVAALADQQGDTGPLPSTAHTAVAAAINRALDADPGRPVDEVAGESFAAASAAVRDAESISTLLVAVLTPTGPGSYRAVFASLGDSRAYLVHPGGATEQATTDHTWSVAETVETTPADQPLQYITRWVGRGATTGPRLETRDVPAGTRVVLSTDELHDFYPDNAELGRLVATAATPGQAADRLIDHAAERGGGNKTAIVINLAGRLPTRQNDDGTPAGPAGAEPPPGSAAPVGAPTRSEPPPGSAPVARPEALAWRAGLLAAVGQTLRVIPVTVTFTAAQVWLARLSGSTAVFSDAGDNLVALVPVALAPVLAYLIPRAGAERLFQRLTGAVMVGLAGTIVYTALTSAHELSGSPWLIIGAGAVNIAGAGLTYLINRRVATGTAEAGVAQALSEIVTTAGVIGTGLVGLLEPAVAGGVDQAVTLISGTTMALLGAGQITGTELELFNPACWGGFLTSLRRLPAGLWHTVAGLLGLPLELWREHRLGRALGQNRALLPLTDPRIARSALRLPDVSQGWPADRPGRHRYVRYRNHLVDAGRVWPYWDTTGLGPLTDLTAGELAELREQAYQLAIEAGVPARHATRITGVTPAPETRRPARSAAGRPGPGP
jgi:serine/threonine protein phosphatase PrpC/LysM repeat protein